MAKAGITIAISGTYNGRAMEKARRDLEKMHISSVKELGGAGSSLVEFGGKVAEVGGKIHNAGYRMEQVGEKATKGITVPMGLAAAACGSAAIDMDTALTGVRKTVDGTEAQYQELKNAAVEFSKTNAVSASQILDIQALGAQLGFTRNELADFGEVVSGLDIATNMNAEQAGTELAQFANITKMAHSEASNYASALVGLGNTSATTESDISSMAMRIAAAGTQVGMSQADILGLAAALSSMGIEAEAGGTAISTIMAQIDKDIAKNSDDVQTWADAAKMSAEEFSEAWKTDPVEALSALFSGMEQATAEGGNMSVMLEELGIDSVRQTDIMKRLAGNSELVGKSVATANDEWKKNTALQNEVDNRNQSLAARLQILQNKVTAVAEEVGGPMVDAALDCLEAADPLIEGAADMAKAFHDMDKEDQRMVLGLAAAAAAFGPVAMGTGKLLQGVGNLTVGMGKGMQKLGVFKNGLSEAASVCGGVRPMLAQVATGTLDLGEKAVDASGKLTTASVATNALGSALTTTAGGLGPRWSCLYDGLRARRLHNGHLGAGGRNCGAHISDQEKRHPHHRHLGDVAHHGRNRCRIEGDGISQGETPTNAGRRQEAATARANAWDRSNGSALYRFLIATIGCGQELQAGIGGARDGRDRAWCHAAARFMPTMTEKKTEENFVLSPLSIQRCLDLISLCT